MSEDQIITYVVLIPCSVLFALFLCFLFTVRRRYGWRPVQHRWIIDLGVGNMRPRWRHCWRPCNKKLHGWYKP